MNLKSMLTTNVQMKLYSLLLAALLCLLAASEAVDEVSIPLSVIYINTPSGLAVKQRPESGRLIHIEGPRILLFRQKLKGVSLQLDLAGAGEGDLVFSGIESSLKLIRGVKLSKPNVLTIELHR